MSSGFERRGASNVGQTKQPSATTSPKVDSTLTQAEAKASAKASGFSGDACTNCGNFTMMRAGTCLTCVSCGSTTGCS